MITFLGGVLAVLLIVITFCADIAKRWGWMHWKIEKHERTCIQGVYLRGRFQGSWTSTVYRGNFEDPIFLSRSLHTVTLSAHLGHFETGTWIKSHIYWRML